MSLASLPKSVCDLFQELELEEGDALHYWASSEALVDELTSKGIGPSDAAHAAQWWNQARRHERLSDKAAVS